MSKKKLSYSQGRLLAKFTNSWSPLPKGVNHNNRTLAVLIRHGFVKLAKGGFRYKLCDPLPTGWSIKHWSEK